MLERASIRFFDENGEYAARYWYHVPRAGDEIMLGAGRGYPADISGKTAFRVKRVVWGTEGPNDSAECVNIELEWIAP